MNRSTSQRLLLVCCLAVLATPNFVQAHQPDRENLPVRQRIDLIGPIGNRLPAGHRRKYNRPSFWEGWIAYRISPSSAEAMSWHRARHAEAYKSPKSEKRIEYHYFYPKPWEAMRTGQRPASASKSTGQPEFQSPYVPSPLTIQDEASVQELTPPEPMPAIDSEDLSLPPVDKTDD